VYELYLKFGKRLFDVTFSLISLIILSPLMISTVLLIKLFDHGPVIFKQERTGLNGIVFNMYKFRSMPLKTKEFSSDQIGHLNLTWIGKFIRRTNIDELPQLINIIKGDMSIVGPRPALPIQKDLIKYRRDNGSLFCLPGLTGLAQVSSFDGMNIHEKTRLDGEYLNSICFKFDLQIIFRTIAYLLRPPPIY